MSNENMQVWNDMNDRLTRFISGKVRDSNVTKDIVQDVFLKTFSNIDALKNKEKLVPWIYQIARNEVISHFRKLKLNQHTEVFIDNSSQEDIFTSEVSECIQPFINSLPEKYRVAIILADIENIPQNEVAKQLNISYSGAKSRVQRGRDMLKTLFYEQCNLTADVYGDIIECSIKKSVDNCNK